MVFNIHIIIKGFVIGFKVLDEFIWFFSVFNMFKRFTSQHNKTSRANDGSDRYPWPGAIWIFMCGISGSWSPSKSLLTPCMLVTSQFPHFFSHTHVFKRIIVYQCYSNNSLQGQLSYLPSKSFIWGHICEIFFIHPLNIQQYISISPINNCTIRVILFFMVTQTKFSYIGVSHIMY